MALTDDDLVMDDKGRLARRQWVARVLNYDFPPPTRLAGLDLAGTAPAGLAAAAPTPDFVRQRAAQIFAPLASAPAAEVPARALAIAARDRLDVLVAVNPFDAAALAAAQQALAGAEALVTAALAAMAEAHRRRLQLLEDIKGVAAHDDADPVLDAANLTLVAEQKLAVTAALPEIGLTPDKLDEAGRALAAARNAAKAILDRLTEWLDSNSERIRARAEEIYAAFTTQTVDPALYADVLVKRDAVLKALVPS